MKADEDDFLCGKQEVDITIFEKLNIFNKVVRSGV